MFVQKTLIICLFPTVLTAASESQMVNCAACAYLTHEPKDWECKVTCDTITDGKFVFTTSIRSMWQGNVFTGVCHSVRRGEDESCSGGFIFLKKNKHQKI